MFKCQGLGHVARNCPTRVMVTRDGYYSFLLHDKNDVGEEEQELAQQNKCLL